MSLTLFFHPLSSFCQKVLVALYENGTPFTPHVVDLGDETSAAAFRAIWPIGKFPVLRDDAMNRTIPESSIIIEYLSRHYPGPRKLVPQDAELAWETRARDRFFDLYVEEPMQKIVGDRRRPGSPRGDAGASAAANRVRHHRCRDGGQDLGDRRELHDGRLWGRAGAVLRQPGAAVR